MRARRSAGSRGRVARVEALLSPPLTRCAHAPALGRCASASNRSGDPLQLFASFWDCDGGAEHRAAPSEVVSEARSESLACRVRARRSAGSRGRVAGVEAFLSPPLTRCAHAPALGRCASASNRSGDPLQLFASFGIATAGPLAAGGRRAFRRPLRSGVRATSSGRAARAQRERGLDDGRSAAPVPRESAERRAALGSHGFAQRSPRYAAAWSRLASSSFWWRIASRCSSVSRAVATLGRRME